MRWLAIVVALGACKRVESTAGPPTAVEVTKACAKYVACVPQYETIESCLANVAYAGGVISAFRPDQIRCVANALGGCEQMLGCLGVSVSTCTTNSFGCVGNKQVECLDGVEYAVDCSGGLYHADDETCVGNSCAFGTCSSPQPDRCNGTRFEHCEFNDVLTGYDCADYGEVCVEQDFGARCEPRAAVPCGTSRCEGEVLIACDGVEHHLDCASLLASGECSDRQGRCLFAEQCAPGEPAACVGDVLIACALGEEVQIDCKQAGFAGCFDRGCVR